MVNYSMLYDIAKYINEMGRGKFSEKEIACSAYDYLCEFQYSKAKGGYHVTSTIQELLRLLDEDNTEQCVEWATQIREELGLNKTA